MKLTTLMLALAATGLTALPQAATAGRATFSFIPSPEPGGPPSEALAINDLEQIFGTWEQHNPDGSSQRATGIMAPTADIGLPITIPIRPNNDLGMSVSGRFLQYGGNSVDITTLASMPPGTIFSNGINNLGTIVGSAPRNIYRQAFRLTLQPDWQGGSGSWTDSKHWNFAGLGAIGLTPGLPHDVVIAPTRGAKILGAANASVHSLSVSGNTGYLATFNLNGGNTATSTGTTIGFNGVLAGKGTLQGGLNVLPGGAVNIAANETMRLTGGAVTLGGTVRAIGTASAPASLSVTGPTTVLTDSKITAQNAKLDFAGGLTLAGQLNITQGVDQVSGPITAQAGGLISVSNRSKATFLDTVDMGAGSTLKVTLGSSATFMDHVFLRTGSVSAGGGTKNFIGGVSIGNSPGYAADEGDISFGQTNTYLAEIGGTTACTIACATDDTLKNNGFDKYVVGGQLTLSGTLALTSWQGFTAQAGQTFDLFDAGTLSGTFEHINASGFQLASGTRLDFSKLYATGEISVTAVPEPEVPALLATGLIVIGLVKRRQQRC